MNAVPSQSLQRLYSRPKLIRYLSLMFLMMAKDSTGDGMEIHADKNGDITGEVSITKNGQCVEEWVHPDHCTSGAVNALRRELSFERDADNTEHATWTIGLAHREVNVQVRLMPESLDTLIVLELEDRLDSADAQQVLDDWFPDGSIPPSFLRSA